MPLGKGDITQIQQLDTQRVDEAGRVKQALQITFTLRGGSRITLVVDKGPDLARRVIEAITKEANERIAVLDSFEEK